MRFGRKRPIDDDARALADLEGVIDRFGWGVLHVGQGPASGEPRFSYTVGLTALGHPEVIAVGLPFEAAEQFLNLVGESVRAGDRWAHGSTTDRFTDADSPVVFLRVEDTSRLTAVAQVYGRVEAVQLVWPDSTGKLPWQEGHRNPPGVQPLLGPRPAD
ncbi:DUF4262 domain-containing protein [Modestobacter versicolor]|uniref:DUF4262 domain-containing protein n=1 Tax=Modestobacter versicolor TaxID=429133 RepID=A0A323V9B0_9ACTN|nr:DUF4262 domain-containing protein [Modestobacter versicolor]MBB3678400.1 hypothetical protein [Modestobacter versicolor]PZA21339.1 hypothetical protein DMO24_10800 [Modestobacter versicolor]